MQDTLFTEAPHAYSKDDIVSQYETDQEKGLTSEETKKRQKKYGLNQLTEKKQKSIRVLLWEQVNTPVMYLLVAAAGVSFAFGDVPEGIAIVVVLLINIGIGFTMEYQARQSMKALKEMDKIQAKVRRDGKTETIDAEQLVPGDIILLEAGDLIPADARLIKSAETEINESPLTGESVPVAKNTETEEENTEVADWLNMVYKGTSMTRGKATGVVTGTGMKTEIGNISEMVSSTEEEEIPLNQKLNSLTKKLIWVVLGMAALLGVVGFVVDQDFYTIIQTSIAWAIAAIPEGLPIVASIALAKGMLRLAKHEVVVKKLALVEALGETNMIFTDKTGTLTENRLTVTKIFLPENKLEVKWNQENRKVSFENQQESEVFEHLLKISVQCNNAVYKPDDEHKSEGDPLEVALLKFAEFHNKEKMQQIQQAVRIGEDPFDSESKMMGTITKEDEHFYVAAKGAGTSIFEISNKILDQGEVKDFSEEDKKQWMEMNDEMANDGLRTLAFAYRTSENKPIEQEEDEFLEDLTFVGLIGFLDPPQEEVKDAIDTCKKAGIEVVMVTGDHPGTAKNIARQVNLVDDENAPTIHGSELKDKSDEEIQKTRIFSRVSPEQKYTLVETFKTTGKIIGMTGDGVNDAPALKKADIGIAMGLRGTQVAKEVADMVLKDDSFASIVRAIRQGRIIFTNIRKFIIYQLSYHFGEILVIAAISFSLLKLPLLPLQLLFLNILLDVFPALALGIGDGRANIMDDPPKDPEEPIVHKKSWEAIIVYGVVIAAVITGAYFFVRFAWGYSHEVGNNVAFFALGFSQLFHTLDMRDQVEHWFSNQVTRNKYVWMAIAFGIVAMLAAYFVPFLKDILSIETLDARVWALIAIASLVPMLINQVVKQVFKL